MIIGTNSWNAIAYGNGKYVAVGSIVTSHQGFFTREAVDNIARTTMQNIKDFSECRRLENEVRAEPENAVGQL